MFVKGKKYVHIVFDANLGGLFRARFEVRGELK